MVFKYLTFNPNDPYLLDARPGSPHPFFSLISSASSSPDVWSNCFGDFSAIHSRFLSTPVHRALEPVRAGAGAVDEVRLCEHVPRCNYAGSPPYRAQRQVPEVGSLFGKVGGMTVDLLDTLGSFSFTAGTKKKGNEKINILAFEVANTVVRGANLMESLSEENIRHLTEVVIPSEGVQCLISEDEDVLLKIAALDLKVELRVFFGVVVQFGNRCKDSQWHNLDSFFQKLLSRPQGEQLKVRAESLMQQLMDLTQKTADLYYELYAMCELEQHYRCKLHDYENSVVSHTGHRDSLIILRTT